MNVNVTKLAHASMAVLATLSTVAWAEDTCHGYSVGNSRDRVLIYLGAEVPMHLASGECGDAHQSAQGKMSSDCTYTDRDGDRWTSRSSWEKGAPEGIWCEITGTGKYEKIMGGCGWWRRVRTGPLNAWEFGGQCMQGMRGR